MKENEIERGSAMIDARYRVTSATSSYEPVVRHYVEKDGEAVGTFDVLEDAEDACRRLNSDTENRRSEPLAAAANAAKRRWDLLDWDVLEEVVEAMEDGARKYKEGDWRGFDLETARKDYFGKALRHMTAAFRGEETDSDSGQAHLSRAMADLMIWRALQRLDRRNPYDTWELPPEGCSAADLLYCKPARETEENEIDEVQQ